MLVVNMSEMKCIDQTVLRVGNLEFATPNTFEQTSNLGHRKKDFFSQSPRTPPPIRDARDSSTHDAPANHPPLTPIIRAPRGPRSEAGRHPTRVKRFGADHRRTSSIISRDRVRRPAVSSRLWERER